ncbi:enoyl-CoA hydratase [Alsobacter soli]|uniref:Enoyl-CoA hydratase n=1 Tax=Alsobacter soli TaxID=2109933 RepID=A0A2T1HPH9_9HYPH|nr:enoyl-CoA hydratase [Alsobacter soli]PSC03555.1 enoyl-CoA hydratase [Alsobacter soli]
MTEPTIRYHARNGVAELVIDNPARRNAMTLGMWRMLPELVARAEADRDVRVIVLAGAGDRAFCAGADISQFGQARDSEASVAAYDEAVAAGDAALVGASLPTVAAIRGACFGGGMGLAMACDLRFAATGSRFRVPAARLGLGYSFKGVRTLVQKLGFTVAADVMLSARIIEAEEAAALRILNQVWPAERFEEELAGRIGMIAGNAPLTLRAAKRALAELARPEAEQNSQAVADLVEACFRSADYREGQAAFREKREPVFRGE